MLTGTEQLEWLLLGCTSVLPFWIPVLIYRAAKETLNTALSD